MDKPGFGGIVASSRCLGAPDIYRPGLCGIGGGHRLPGSAEGRSSTDPSRRDGGSVADGVVDIWPVLCVDVDQQPPGIIAFFFHDDGPF